MSSIKIPILDLKPQYQAIKADVQQALDEVLESGQFILGATVKQFESEVADYLGVKHAIGVNSGTDALVIALRALEIGAGDEVITTSFSFFATAESISLIGAKPVFVDIDRDSFNIDPGLIEAAITPKTKAILPVHLYGNPAAIAQVKDIANRHNLKIIEDCAQSFGAVYKGDCSGCQQTCKEDIRHALSGQKTGALGDMAAFSFFPTKNLGAYGDGGLITTNDDQLAELASMLRVHGSKKRYHNEMLGYNSRLDAMQAAILRVKLAHIDAWNQQRRQVAKNYTDLLAHIPGVITPDMTDGHVFHQYTIRILDGKRDQVKQDLAAVGIGAMIYYPFPLDRLPIYKGQYEVNSVSDDVGTEVMSLPIWPELSIEKIEQVVGAIKNSLAAL
ncbi:MAG: DegT/DnrJ/EryC1/StrS family aminotransferase [Cyanobacteria bacterium J06650_10]